MSSDLLNAHLAKFTARVANDGASAGAKTKQGLVKSAKKNVGKNKKNINYLDEARKRIDQESYNQKRLIEVLSRKKANKLSRKTVRKVIHAQRNS